MEPFSGNCWNGWKYGDDGQNTFVYLNSVRIFADDTVWYVDTGAPVGNVTPKLGAQKLFRLDPDSGKILDIVRFNEPSSRSAPR